MIHAVFISLIIFLTEATTSFVAFKNFHYDIIMFGTILYDILSVLINS